MKMFLVLTAVRVIVGFPLLFLLALMYLAFGRPEAIDAAGSLISMWMLAGKYAKCDDILEIVKRRSSVRVGDWLPQSRSEWQ